MIYLISGMNETQFEKLKQKSPEYSRNFKSIPELMIDLNKNGAKGLQALVIMAGLSEYTPDSIESLSITLRSINADARVFMGFQTEAHLDAVNALITSTFDKALVEILPASVSFMYLRNIGEKLLMSKEVAAVEETAISVEDAGSSALIGIVRLTDAYLPFNFILSLAKSLTLNLKTVNYFETNRSAGQIRHYLGEESANSVISNFSSNRVLDLSKGISLSPKFNVFPATSQDVISKEFIKAASGLSGATFIDLGPITNNIIELSKEFDEVWVMTEPPGIYGRTSLGLPDNCKVILMEYDEFTRYEDTIGKRWEFLDCIMKVEPIPLVVYRKCLFNKSLLVDMEEYQSIIKRTFQPLVNRVVSICG